MERESRGALAISAIIKSVAGLLIMGLLLFIPAGTLHYTGAWLLLALLFIPMIVFGVAMFFIAPELLQKRLNSKEQRTKQSLVVQLSGVMFIVGFVVAGFDYRYGWSVMPTAVVVVAPIAFLVAYALYVEVIRENEWLSRTIEVSEGQRVVSTGLYGVVRHPMYLATLLLFLSMPLVLGLWWALIPFLFYIPIIVIRISDEERLLRAGLAGYSDYCTRVKWRIIPYVW